MKSSEVNQEVGRIAGAQNRMAVILGIPFALVSVALMFVLCVVLPAEKEKAAAQAQVIVIDNLRQWQISEREHDANSSSPDPYRSERDRVMRGIGRLRSAMRLKMAIHSRDDEIYGEQLVLVQKEIENEIKHLAPIVYRLRSREVFMDFVHELNYVGFDDPVQVLGTEFQIELNRAQ